MGKRAKSEVWPYITAHLEAHDAPVIAGLADLSPEELAAAEAEADAIAAAAEGAALLRREMGMAAGGQQGVRAAA